MRGARLGRMQLLLVLALAMLPVSTTFSLLPATQAPSCPGLATCPKRLLLAARARPGRAQWQAMAAGDSEGGEADPVPISGADWRQFRARLVAQEKGDSGEDIQAGDGWAYETGNMVENGSLLLGGSELEFTFGLRQQYFHKCVMLVLSHTKDFTKGIIVNRPTSRRTAGGWRIWYGGDVQGINAPAAMQEAVCLHKSSAEAVVEVSEPVIKGIYTCSLEAAEKLVEDGKAQPEDFWLLMGYAGWAPGQLQMEIDARSSWHVAAASPVLLSELIAQAADSKTAEAGISVWETLMAKIGLADKAAKVSGSFEDRMLREWAREHVTKDPLVLKSEAMDNLLRAASRRSLRGADRGTPVGTMLRTSPTSPYILEQQFLHKALLLVVQDTDDMTVAVVLNRQTQKAASFKGDDTEKRRLIFFGGEFDAGGNRVMWLTANDAMRERGLGTVVSPANRDSGQEGEVSELDPGVVISRCSGEEAVEAINRKIATADDFLLVRGFQLWPKGAAAMQVSEAQAFKGLSVAEGGLQAEIDLGRMEEVPGLSKEIWQQLLALATPGDDKDAPVELGVSAWQASAPAVEGGDEVVQAVVDEGVQPSLKERAALGDEALNEYVQFFFSTADN